VADGVCFFKCLFNTRVAQQRVPVRFSVAYSFTQLRWRRRSTEKSCLVFC